MEKRNRDHKITFWVSEEERKIIRQRMYLSHTKNQSAYLRKMAMDGCIINVDTEYLKKQFEEMHKIGINVNQLAKHANTTGEFYQQDMKNLQKMIQDLWKILKRNAENLTELR